MTASEQQREKGSRCSIKDYCDISSPSANPLRRPSQSFACILQVGALNGKLGRAAEPRPGRAHAFVFPMGFARVVGMQPGVGGFILFSACAI